MSCPAAFGEDTISDFTAGSGVTDVLHLTLGTAFDTYAEVIAAATQVGADTVINIHAADTITLTNVLKTALVADDFWFVQGVLNANCLLTIILNLHFGHANKN